MRILIADADPAARKRLARALIEHRLIPSRVEAADARSAVESAVRDRPELMLVDADLPGGATAAIAEISSRVPNVKAIMLSEAGHEREFFAALRAGAVGYLEKDIGSAGLARALRDVLDGGAAIPRRLLSVLATEFRDEASRRRAVVSAVGERLTSREWQVLDLLQRGLSTREIAERLFLSPVTVRSHVAATMRKLGVADRHAALRAVASASGN